jgi:aminoglycoside phosphotransferase (APT) family kinase protein
LAGRGEEDALRSFVEGAVGGRVVAMERTAVGSSRVTLLVDVEDGAGESQALVLRHDSGDGPLSGTDIDLAHEAVIYRALASEAVRIPRLVAEAPDGRTLLIERADGTEAFGALEPAAERARVASDFAEALAELHRVDPASLELPGVARPKDAQEHALLDLRRWIGIQRTRVEEPAEITRLAGDWLAAHPPDHVDRSALCHGDAGAGNFLHEGGRVTALLDWEFAHLGDPIDDLAWVLVRSHLLGGEEEMRAALPAWSQRAGLPLDGARIRYYRALVLLRMGISCQVALGHARRSKGAMDTTTYELLLPYLGFLLPQALREAGCREPGLDGLAQEARATVDAHPVLRAAARPLTPWESA